MALPAGTPNAVAVTPHDTNPVIATGGAFSGVYVGGAGNVAVKTVGGQSVTFTAPPVGTFLWVRGTHVLATGTTATNLVALY
jgi:hypothetical protein